MNRRDFLMNSAFAVGGASAIVRAAAGAVSAAGRAGAQTPDAARLARVAIMTYSFDRIVRIPGRPEQQGRTLELFDIPKMYADR